ncbi:MAG: motility protein A [Phycisphaerae bacterium]
MDLATIIGIVCGFALVIIAIMGGTAGGGMFLHVPSMLVVVGGMAASTLIHFPAPTVLRIFSIIRKTIFCQLPGENELIQQMVNYAAINRRDGALALEKQIPEARDPFLVMGLRMVIDGQEENVIEKQLYLEIQYLQERHSTGKKILEFMGASAPAFGMIGTLIGLVQMLADLSDPSKIGEGMATALITTFYGALLANLIFIPLAGKLGIRSKKESLIREMIVEGLLGITRGESPTAVREKMQAFVSVKNREEFKPTV